MILFWVNLVFSLGVSGIRLHDIQVPKYVKKGERAKLTCDYKLDNDVLYSLKWYKDDGEFFRYIPNDHPKGFSIKQPGVKVDVSNITYRHPSQWPIHYTNR